MGEGEGVGVGVGEGEPGEDQGPKKWRFCKMNEIRAECGRRGELIFTSERNLSVDAPSRVAADSIRPSSCRIMGRRAESSACRDPGAGR